MELVDKENALRIRNVKNSVNAKVKTPSKSPFKICGDRFVPSRSGIDWSLKSGIYNDLWSTPKKKRPRLAEYNERHPSGGPAHGLSTPSGHSGSGGQTPRHSASTPRRPPVATPTHQLTPAPQSSLPHPQATKRAASPSGNAPSGSTSRRRIDFDGPATSNSSTSLHLAPDQPSSVPGLLLTSSPIQAPTATGLINTKRPGITGGGVHLNFALGGAGGLAQYKTSRRAEISSIWTTSTSTYDKVLDNELLGTTHDNHYNERIRVVKPGLRERKMGMGGTLPLIKGLGGHRPLPVRKLFNFSVKNESNAQVSPFSLTSLSVNTENLLKSPRKIPRKIPKAPYKVLDAPDLQDDFYLNLVDWSSRNTLAVGLGSCVYLWSAYTSQVTKLCDVSLDNDTITSLSWCDDTSRAHYLALGTHKGGIQVWDVGAHKKIQDFTGHTGRVSVSAWNSDLLCSGSRDRNVLQFDLRTHYSTYQRQLTGHRQEVCGMKWAPEKNYLATGGNDNKLLLWDIRSTNHPIQEYLEHTAAVKAITWCPQQRGLLVSGGGTVDRCIKFWNTTTSKSESVHSIDTGSQVCNLAWSKNSNEFVSTHGYSQNQIVIWKYPALTQMATLTGHSYRVLYLALSPDGESIVTGAGDETLRFWNVFSKPMDHKVPASSLNLFTHLR